MINFKIKNIQKAKGITLIALVVTIVVLLILAAVSISMLAGEDGIVRNAQRAKDENEDKSYMEMIQLAVNAAMIGENGYGEISRDRIISELNKLTDKSFNVSTEEPYTVSFGTNVYQVSDNGTVTKVEQGGGGPTTSKLNANEKTGMQSNGITEIAKENVTNTKIKENENIRAVITGEVPIPYGFYYVGGTLNEGVVISDNEADSGKGTSHEVAQTLVGNQFVWVPVPVADDFARYDGYFDGALESNQDWFNIANCSEPYASGYSKESDEYTEMYKSTTENKGFYVARYEASQGTDGAESKQGKTVWNNIPWGTAMNDIGTTGAVYKAQQMYTGKTGFYVTSTLIYGVQWDAIMYWIDPAYKTGTCNTSTSYVANSTGKGYYGESNPTTTGSSSDYSVKNIYDLAGNVWEWTMEAYDTSSRVKRGSYYNGSYYPVSYRINNNPLYSDDSLGFRTVLFFLVEKFE